MPHANAHPTHTFSHVSSSHHTIHLQTTTLPTEPLCLALHPSGLTALVALGDRLCLLQLLHRSLRTAWEVNVRGCRECCFSNGGHLVAAVNGPNVLLYDAHTAEHVGSLRSVCIRSSKVSGKD